ncbi:hypothetical protein [Nocardiopsis sp. YSL2]|uniref:hypothetical protein n=1 Tax=Nocardiopsis sp. YSL2 TaxID=2939492 RepID=UPI0026F455E5|nr:hypothetical protein [Nocardiopsis sp. YSL2]
MRAPSADPGLYFDVSLTYQWRITDGDRQILHPDEVARSLLVGALGPVTAVHPVLHVQEAGWAANRALSAELDGDGRIRVAGSAHVAVSTETEARARARASARERVRLEQAEHVARLEVLRETVLTQGLGLLWWLDRHEAPGTGTDPEEWTRRLIDSYRELAAVVREDRTTAEPDGLTVLRTRMEEALAAVKDPEVAQRFAYHLEDYLKRVTGG